MFAQLSYGVTSEESKEGIYHQAVSEFSVGDEIRDWKDSEWQSKEDSQGIAP